MDDVAHTLNESIIGLKESDVCEIDSLSHEEIEVMLPHHYHYARVRDF